MPLPQLGLADAARTANKRNAREGGRRKRSGVGKQAGRRVGPTLPCLAVLPFNDDCSLY